MLGGVLCATRPKPWILSNTFLLHASIHHSTRLLHAPPYHVPHLLPPESFIRRRHHSSACKHGGGGGVALIWHAIMPCGSSRRGGDGFDRGGVVAVHHHDHEMKGEGSWNVAWDARPARWLHRLDSAWLLFGVCACIAPPPIVTDADTDATPTAITNEAALPLDVNPEGRELNVDGISIDYRVTGVIADGRCLFRALAHGACLRAKVVEELLKRREETEWFIEGDFDAYVKRIQQPYVWGGEPELLMASHVLKTPILVFMRNSSSLNLVNIAKYGEEHKNENNNSINVLFHGYGHYDLIEPLPDENSHKINI